MLHVKFSRDTNDQLFITDYNDEQLYVVAQTISHREVAKLENLLANLTQINDDMYHPIRYTQHITISVLVLTEETIMLKFKDDQDLNEQTDRLQVEIPIETLQQLIEDWRDLIPGHPEHIFLTRHQDVYSLSVIALHDQNG